jgi:hypothetical protein
LTGLIDWLEANAQVHFIHTASQSPDVPRARHQLYLRLFQRICAEQAANPNPLTMRRLNVMLAVFRSDCAAGNIPTTFGVPQPFLAVRTLQGDDEPTHIEKLVAKALDKLRPSADNRDGRLRPRNIRNMDQSCFWCGAKGHTLFECTKTPSNSEAKAARDLVITNRELKNFRRAESRRITPAASSTHSIFTTDDEFTDELDD